MTFINSPTYHLSKYLCTLMTPRVNDSDCQVKKSYEFVKFANAALCRPRDVMVSFDVISLFTNIPIKLALEIAVDRLRCNKHLHERTKLDISDISMLLEFCLNACDIFINGNYYHQKCGCPMGSPISIS